MATVLNRLSDQSAPPSKTAVPWAAIGWFSALLIAGYLPILSKLVDQWSYDEDVSHGFLVAPVALWVAWQRKDALLRLECKPELALGGFVLLWGTAQAWLGVIAAELFLQRTAFLISLVGILLALGGKPLFRALLFPLLLLAFMIPIPTVIYNQITFPLQLFASQVAEVALGLVGIPVLRDGNILELASQKLSVAEACSGIRSLLSLAFVALVFGYLFDSKIWMRWVLFLGTIPIAIIANSGRVTITGMLSEVDPELAHGFFHSLEGFLIFFIALVMMFALHWIILFIVKLRAPEPAEEVHGA